MFIAAPDESADSAALYKSSADAEGFVMNFSRAWAWRPDVFAGFATLRQQLTSHSALTRRDLAILVCATAAELGDSYCSLAWGRTLATEAGAAAAAAVIQNSGGDGLGVRDHALAAWARCVVADPNATTGDDVERLRDAGMTDREIFESTGVGREQEVPLQSRQQTQRQITPNGNARERCRQATRLGQRESGSA